MARRPKPRKRVISILKQGKKALRVSKGKSSVHISYKRKDVVEWTCKSGAAEIRFKKDSPFHEKVFSIPCGGSVTTGRVVGAEKVHKHFRYSIKMWVAGERGPRKRDPEVVVDP